MTGLCPFLGLVLVGLRGIAWLKENYICSISTVSKGMGMTVILTFLKVMLGVVLALDICL